MDFPTIEAFVGNTPLARLQRLPGVSSNTILVKLEGNNPAGSVKDRPALSMISRAELRGDIKPDESVARHRSCTQQADAESVWLFRDDRYASG